MQSVSGGDFALCVEEALLGALLKERLESAATMEYYLGVWT